MNREYHKWFSSALGRDMELLVFGHGGTPLLVFPTSMGRFYDYEDRGMIHVISSRYEEGVVQAFCVDSADQESWYNKDTHPRQRVLRHLDYENYLLRDAIPFIRSRNASGSPITTGCSFGGYHAVNFALRHPDQVSGCVSMGGAFDIHQFLNGYYDDNCYFNCPPDFLPNLNDPWFLRLFGEFRKFVLATGERDICLYDNCLLSHIMSQKGIPHVLDVWGDGTGHDWLWWHQMAMKFFP
jgi:esterase/lipase superfamily enzyme